MTCTNRFIIVASLVNVKDLQKNDRPVAEIFSDGRCTDKLY